MAQVSPFHSVNSSVSGVYHICTKCQAGQQIPWTSRFQARADSAFANSAGIGLASVVAEPQTVKSHK